MEIYDRIGPMWWNDHKPWWSHLPLELMVSPVMGMAWLLWRCCDTNEGREEEEEAETRKPFSPICGVASALLPEDRPSHPSVPATEFSNYSVSRLFCFLKKTRLSKKPRAERPSIQRISLPLMLRCNLVFSSVAFLMLNFMITDKTYP